MLRPFEGRTADSVWRRIAASFRTGNNTRLQPSRAGDTYEMLHASISIADPRQRWVVSRHPPINPAFAIAEIVWVINGRNDAPFLNYFNRELPKYAGQCPTYHGAYGYRLRSHFGTDQLERAYQALRRKPDSRQVVLQIWDSTRDLPGANGEESSPDIPCNLFSLLKVREGKLEWLQIMRSSDVHRGLPYDIAQFTTIQEVLAGWLGIGLGSYNHISDSLHVYTDTWAQVCNSSSIRVAANRDSFAFPKEESERSFQMLGQVIEKIISPEVSANHLVALTSESPLPETFQNMLYVLCAEGLRRRGRPDLMSRVMASCTNPIYRQLYERWLTRFAKAANLTERYRSLAR